MGKTKQKQRSYTDEDRARANALDICDVAAGLGLTVTDKRRRISSTKEHDSLKFFDHNNYYWYSKNTSGDVIAFVMDYLGCDFPTAMEYLVGEAAGTRFHTQAEAPKEEKKPFQLPKANKDYSNAARYLTEVRGFSTKEVIDFVSAKLIYEDVYSNVVFVGYDKAGKARYAAKRGTATVGVPYKKDVSGTDKAYCFNWVNKKSDTLIVTEAPLDTMSYVALSRITLSDPRCPNLLALGGTASKALKRMLKDYDHIKKVWLFLDCDEAGSAATEKILQEAEAKEYGREVQILDKRRYELFKNLHVKDLNEFLIVKNAARRSYE